MPGSPYYREGGDASDAAQVDRRVGATGTSTSMLHVIIDGARESRGKMR